MSVESMDSDPFGWRALCARAAMKISFLASHGGTAVRHIISAIKSGDLEAEVGIVITNNRDSAIFEWCNRSGIQVCHISGKTHPDESAKDEAIAGELEKHCTELVVLSGYLKKIGPVTLKKYANSILNIHPSLLPKHGGKGFYGDKVHEAVLASGDSESGATVQIIDEEYDAGPIVCQRSVDISEGETLESLKEKIESIEGDLYVSAIRKLAHNNKSKNDAASRANS